MTRFLDGPAEGVTLMLRRAPHYLRAVRAAEGEWDALDQLDDYPKGNETVVAYEMVSGPFTAHVQRREKGRRVCGWYQGGEYRVVAEQPTDNVLRVTALWRDWVSERIGKPVAADGTIEGAP